MDQTDEFVFNIQGTVAHSLKPLDIASLHFTERAHLQEWVLGKPEIIAPGVLIITFEFDQWAAPNGQAPRDRLDVLGLGTDGRLVLTELKRGKAPDTVDMQAIKYAAMASRFSEDTLVKLHLDFLNRRGPADALLTEDEVAEKLNNHVPTGLTPEGILSPRIVILAEDFSPTVTASVMWLNEQGVDITLKVYKAYETESGETILTVSQYYPTAEVEVTPRPRQSRPQTELLPDKPWTIEDLQLLRSLPFEVPHAVMDLCSGEPGSWVGSSAVYESAGVEQAAGMGKFAGFGYSVRRRFGRANPPWSSEWGKGGVSQQYYSIDQETAGLWLKVRQSDEESSILKAISTSGV